MIIYINEQPGSGKTTLANKLSKNKHLMVVELDNINDYK